MKRRIRMNGEIKEMDFELGSGIFDKSGLCKELGDYALMYRKDKNTTFGCAREIEIVGHINR